MKELRLKQLEESYEKGIITTEEYERQRKEIEEMPEEKIEKDLAEEPKDVGLKSDKMLIVGVILVVVIFAVIFAARYFVQEKPTTIDELHQLNLKGKLKEEQGYLYDAYSFIKFDGLWYMQLMSPGKSRLYNLQFRFGPKELESININGQLNTELFDNTTEYYVTFNPTGNDFSSVALAVGDFNQHMTRVFFKQPIAACDRNETSACIGRPIITCNNTDMVVLYVKENNETEKVDYDSNCIIVEGKGFGLVKAINRVLYDFYTIIN